MERPLRTARLTEKRLLSECSQTYELGFELPAGEPGFDFAPGQFLSVVSERTRPDGRLKSETRAYSLASAPDGSRFELCLNRAPRAESGKGFFSHLLCDLAVGGTIEFHGPHGDFVLRQPLADSLLVAHDTGIAPIRSMLMALFPNVDGDNSSGKQLCLLHGATDEAELFYAELFRSLDARIANFHYLPVLSAGAESWEGLRGSVVDQIPGALEQHPLLQAAYICGLNEMVSPARAALKSLGWDRKQIVFERYD